MLHSKVLTSINRTRRLELSLTTDPAALFSEGEPVTVFPESRPGTALRDFWDAHAEEWINWVREPRQLDSYWRFHRKVFLSLIPDPGRLTLDIGCGEGRVGRDLQEAGHRALGVDWSFTMCQAAATHPERPSRVVVGDAAKLPLADASVDCVVAFMALQDIDDLRGAVKEIARVLEDGQKLALAIVHPMYSSGRFSAAERNQDDGFVIKRSYFKPKLLVSKERWMTFYREHRPLQTYAKALLDYGFSIEQLHEVTGEDESKPWHRVPMFLDILATRRPREREVDSVRRFGFVRRTVFRISSVWRNRH